MFNSKVKQVVKVPGVAQTETKTKAGPIFPTDHGAYAMLLVPTGIGLIVGTIQGISASINPAPAFILLILALLASFFARDPLEVVLKPGINETARQRGRFWLAIYLLVAAATGIPLLFLWQLWGLLWLTIPAALPLLAYFISRKWHKQRSLGVRLFGIAALTLGAPAAYYVATGEFDTLALGLYAACLIYFGSTLFYVRIWFEAKKYQKIARGTGKLIPAWLIQATLLYHLAGAAVLAVLIFAGMLPWTVALAYLPLIIKVAMAFRKPPIYIPIKQVGLFEFAHSFVFAILLILSLR